MSLRLQNIYDTIQQDENIPAEHKAAILKTIKDAYRELEITLLKPGRKKSKGATNTIRENGQPGQGEGINFLIIL